MLERPGCCGGQGQCPRWTSTAHMPPRSLVSSQRGPQAPPALRGLRMAPHTLAGLGQVQQHHHLTLCDHRRGSAAGCPGVGEPCGRGVTQGTSCCGNAAPSARGSDFGPFSGPHGGLLWLPDLQEGSWLPAAPMRWRPPVPIETGPGPEMEHMGAGVIKPHGRGRPLLTRSNLTVGLPRGPPPVELKPPAVSTGLAGDEGGGAWVG